MFTAHFGWVENRLGADRFAAQPSVGNFGQKAAAWFAMSLPDEVMLWEFIRQVKPDWQRGAQGIGDCVSWGAELATTCLLAIMAQQGELEWVTEAATESIYGGARVECEGGRLGGYSDGTFGGNAAQWLRDYGVLLRLDYSKETGNPAHNLSTYSSDRAKDWGNYGCGGAQDKGKLDAVAKTKPIQAVTRINSTLDMRTAIAGGAPCTIASNAGFGNMQRDQNGVCRWSGSWSHQMCVLGYRKMGDSWLYRIFQSWGSKSCSGPDPGITWPAASGCSWWCVESDMSRIITSGDCWAFNKAAGWERPGPNWDRALRGWV